MRLILIEGIPGSGKSTMAETLCAIARAGRRDAVWHLEEAANHPAHPRPMHPARHESGFAEGRLECWREFTQRVLRQSQLHILEGSAFQSTIRFMLEDEYPSIEEYHRQFENCVSPLSPLMIYLRPHSALDHAYFIMRHRGQDWTNKVSKYLEATPYCRNRGLRGENGMAAFWENYARFCDSLVATSRIPTSSIIVVPGEWERHCAEAAEAMAKHTQANATTI